MLHICKTELILQLIFNSELNVTIFIGKNQIKLAQSVQNTVMYTNIES